MLAEPVERPKSPVSMEIVVDLPAPLWPRSEKIYPLYILRLMPLTAWKPFGYTFVKSCTFMY